MHRRAESTDGCLLIGRRILARMYTANAVQRVNLFTSWGKAQCLLKFSCRLSSYWSIYEKSLFKILIFLFLRIFLACFPLTLLFSNFQSIKNTVNRTFLTSFFISLQYIRRYFYSYRPHLKY